MNTTTRMSWTRTATGWESSCGRFRIGPHSTKFGYRGLADVQTGQEHVCRTDESAKTLARNILLGR